MNTDIRLSVGFWQHPKTKKTVRRLGLEGVRSLQILWLWAAVNRADGNLSGMDWEDIELAADWQGEEHAFFDVCLGMWIDQSEVGTPCMIGRITTRGQVRPKIEAVSLALQSWHR